MENPLRQTIPDGTEIIETLGWYPDEGVRHASLHIARMARTAAELGYRFDAEIAVSLLQGVASPMPSRCRLCLSCSGLTLSTSVLSPSPPLWRIGIATTRINSADPWLGHKTTNRRLYDQTRAALPAGQDEQLFLNERGELCEGTITNLFVTLADGTKVTPPLTSGLLPGILRQTLLEQGHIERVLTLSDLHQAREIFMGNALRGLIPVEMDLGD
jgi:4-amino-4-deoxychorismate lyase